QFLQCRRIGDRQLAGVVDAHVGGRFSLLRGPILRQRSRGRRAFFVADQHLRGSEARPDHLEQRRVVSAPRPDQHHFARLVEQEIGRQQHLAQRGRRAGEQGPEALQERLGLLAIFRLAGDRLEPQQRQRGDGISRRLRPVVGGLLARQQLLVIGGGAEEAAVGIGEALRQRIVQSAGGLQPARCSGYFVYIEKR